MCGCDRVRAWILLAVLLLLPAGLRAQDDVEVLPSPGVALVVGAVNTDFGEVDPADGGTAVGLRFDLPLASVVVLEPSVERVSLDTSDEASVRWQLDFAVRGEVPLGRLRPFAGLAVGALLWPGDARPAAADFVVATYGGLAGARWRATSRLDLRGEVRLRWLDGLESTTTTFDAGVGWRF